MLGYMALVTVLVAVFGGVSRSQEKGEQDCQNTVNGHGESLPQMMKQRFAMAVSLTPSSLP